MHKAEGAGGEQFAVVLWSATPALPTDGGVRKVNLDLKLRFAGQRVDARCALKVFCRSL